MEMRGPGGAPAVKAPVCVNLSETDLLIDCAEFDVGLAWERLRAAQEIYGAIARRSVSVGRFLLEPNAN